MPESVVGWAMFTFFAIGAVGGWIVIGKIAAEVWKSFERV